MTPKKQKDIEDLIELQKKKDANEVLSAAQDQDLMRLKLANKAYMSLPAAEMGKLLEKELKDKQFQSEEINEIVDIYKSKFKDKPWYEEPKVEGNKSTFKFPSLEEEVKFGMDLAADKRKFYVVDAQTNTVVAYSNGDGKLYHGDGKEFGKGDDFYPCSVKASEFSMPSPSPAPSLTP